MLKPKTIALLERMHSRRVWPSTITNRKNSRGYWILTTPRVRTLRDYQFLADHPRTPAWARERANRWIDGAASEAQSWNRRYPELA